MIKKYSIWLYVIILLVLSIVSLCVGRYSIKLDEIVNIIFNNADKVQEANLLLNIRLPRILLVIISGAALALSGMVFQSIFQNPLISPDVLGVSSGCSLGLLLELYF